MAVNRVYAKEDAPLSAGDELALIPPVSGGAQATAVHARVTDEPLSLDALVARVGNPAAGAIVTFQGVTREVDRLDYEAYAEMATEVIEGIVAAAVERHGACAGGGGAPRRLGRAGRAVGGRRRVGAAPRRGVRGRAGDHRRDQGAGADLEARGRGESARWVDGTTPAT